MIFGNHAAHAFCFPVKASSHINTFGFLFDFFLLRGPAASAGRGEQMQGKLWDVFRGWGKVGQKCWDISGISEGIWGRAAALGWVGRNLKSLIPGCFSFSLLELLCLGNLLGKSGFSTSRDPSLSTPSSSQTHQGTGLGRIRIPQQGLRDLGAAERSGNEESEGGIEIIESFDVEEKNC